MASGCDQCMWAVGVAAGHVTHWAWSLGRALNDVISGQCMFKS